MCWWPDDIEQSVPEVRLVDDSVEEGVGHHGPDVPVRHNHGRLSSRGQHALEEFRVQVQAHTLLRVDHHQLVH